MGRESNALSRSSAPRGCRASWTCLRLGLTRKLSTERVTVTLGGSGGLQARLAEHPAAPARSLATAGTRGLGWRLARVGGGSAGAPGGEGARWAPSPSLAREPAHRAAGAAPAAGALAPPQWEGVAGPPTRAGGGGEVPGAKSRHLVAAPTPAAGPETPEVRGEGGPGAPGTPGWWARGSDSGTSTRSPRPCDSCVPLGPLGRGLRRGWLSSSSWGGCTWIWSCGFSPGCDGSWGGEERNNPAPQESRRWLWTERQQVLHQQPQLFCYARISGAKFGLGKKLRKSVWCLWPLFWSCFAGSCLRFWPFSRNVNAVPFATGSGRRGYL